MKRPPLKYIVEKGNEKLLTNVNNNSPAIEKQNKSLAGSRVEGNITNEKENLSDKVILETDSEGSDDCVIESCDDSTSKENSKNLKWEKLKPVSCKIKNSKIIYQNETTLIDDSKIEKERYKNKMDQVKKSKTEKKSQEDDDGDFFLCRRPKIEIVKGDDQFKKLSDEVVLSILRWLPKRSLINCAMVSKRFYRLAYDEALWTRMDLGGKNLPPGTIGSIIQRGCRILRLAQTAVSIRI